MSDQVTGVSERYPTLLTDVWLVPSVSPLMSGQVARVRERLPALLTSVWSLLPSVSPHVFGQVARCRERLHTLIAVIRSLPRVRMEMNFQLCFCFKVAAAFTTLM